MHVLQYSHYLQHQAGRSFIEILKVDFSLIKSYFRKESINLNFPLVLVILRTLPRPKQRTIGKRRCCGTDSKRKKKNVKVDFALAPDSLNIQNCRLTCSFPDTLIYPDFIHLKFQNFIIPKLLKLKFPQFQAQIRRSKKHVFPLTKETGGPVVYAWLVIALHW